LFGLSALALAAIGVYGLMASEVASRLREMAIRCALGASRATLLIATLSQGLLLTAWGLLLGVAGSLAVTRALESLLFDTSPNDLATMAVVLGILLTASTVACLLPALRAARIDPAITLKVE
jgi:putative ABC transport system permease protein